MLDDGALVILVSALYIATGRCPNSTDAISRAEKLVREVRAKGY
jgi:hypothetical protein